MSSMGSVFMVPLTFGIVDILRHIITPTSIATSTIIMAFCLSASLKLGGPFSLDLTRPCSMLQVFTWICPTEIYDSILSGVATGKSCRW